MNAPKQRLAVVLAVWLVLCFGLIAGTVLSFVTLKSRPDLLTAACGLVAVGVVAVTVWSSIATLRYGDQASSWTTVCAAALLLCGALLFFAAGGMSYLSLTSDFGMSDSNVASRLHRDPSYPFVGYWKIDCYNRYGVAIDRAGAGKYSVSFCGSSCFRPGWWRPNTAFVDDRNYRVIDEDTIDFVNKRGHNRYVRCQ